MNFSLVFMFFIQIHEGHYNIFLITRDFDTPASLAQTKLLDVPDIFVLHKSFPFVIIIHFHDLT